MCWSGRAVPGRTADLRRIRRQRRRRGWTMGRCETRDSTTPLKWWAVCAKRNVRQCWRTSSGSAASEHPPGCCQHRVLLPGVRFRIIDHPDSRNPGHVRPVGGQSRAHPGSGPILAGVGSVVAGLLAVRFHSAVVLRLCAVLVSSALVFVGAATTAGSFAGLLGSLACSVSAWARSTRR